jgi:hypothetical protein
MVMGTVPIWVLGLSMSHQKVINVLGEQPPVGGMGAANVKVTGSVDSPWVGVGTSVSAEAIWTESSAAIVPATRLNASLRKRRRCMRV